MTEQETKWPESRLEHEDYGKRGKPTASEEQMPMPKAEWDRRRGRNLAAAINAWVQQDLRPGQATKVLEWIAELQRILAAER